MPASPAAPGAETGWLADFVYIGGRFETGLAMFAGPSGLITRFSRADADLDRAQRLPNRAILPGLVNAHSHAFQRVIRGRTEHRTAAQSDTFWTWRNSMYHAANRLSPEDLYDAARMAFLEMVLSGITTVGEFHYVHHSPGGEPYAERNLLAFQVLRAAKEVGLRIALLRTAYVRAGWQKPADPGQARFITPCVQDFIADTEDLCAAVANNRESRHAWIGVAPHSIRAVPLDYLREVAAYARANDLVLHMHVAEQPAEVEACVAEYGLSPVALLHKERLLNSRFTAVHAIHITPAETDFLAAAQAGVCVCPTTERNLGDGTSPADELLAAGIGICLGSDSNIQIDLLEDARELEYHLRMNRMDRAVLAADASHDTLARQLLDCATEKGSQSLAAPGGKLEPGRPADFFTVDLNDPSIAGAAAGSLLTNIVFSLERTAVRDVSIGGIFVIREGRHQLQDQIVKSFDGAQKRLWGKVQ
jgi:formimidoylglutamate deiminase